MRRWRGWLVAALVLGLAGLLEPGCSSGSGGSGGGTCQSSSDCTKWRCTCNDGMSISLAECIMNQCADANQACRGNCDNHGGLKSTTPVPTVSNSPECDAFCNKAKSLNCASSDSCDRSFWCSVPQGECAAQVKAELQCQVDQGTWSCQNGGFSVSSGSCMFSQLCAEAGAGGAGGASPSDAGAE